MDITFINENSKPQISNCTLSNLKFWVYPKITINLKFLLFYPYPKVDKRNFKLVSVQNWNTTKTFNNYVQI
jgi:hypothetical protein